MLCTHCQQAIALPDKGVLIFGRFYHAACLQSRALPRTSWVDPDPDPAFPSLARRRAVTFGTAACPQCDAHVDAFAVSQLRYAQDCPQCGAVGVFDPSQYHREQIALSLAQQRDAATLAALHRRGITLEQALPRLSRRVQAACEVILLDGQPLIEFDAPRVEHSADGRTVTASVQSREVQP